MDDSQINMNCYICNDVYSDVTLYTLCTSKTTISQKTYPEMIAMLLGCKFAVFLTPEDTICFRCAELLNEIDKLEFSLIKFKREIIGFLKQKYDLPELDIDLNVCENIVTNNEELSGESSYLSEINIEEVDKTKTVENNIQPDTNVNLDNGDETIYQRTFDKNDYGEHVSSEEKNHTHEEHNSKSNLSYTLQNLFENPQEIYFKPFRCLQCTKTFDTQEELSTHSMTHTVFSCDFCCHPFPSTHKLSKHMYDCELRQSQTENKKMYFCPTCKKSFVNTVVFREHVDSHLKDRTINVTTPTVQNSTKIKNHLETKQNGYECEQTVQSMQEVMLNESEQQSQAERNNENDIKELLNDLEDDNDTLQDNDIEMDKIPTILNKSTDEYESSETKNFSENTSSKKKGYTEYVCAICNFRTTQDVEMRKHISIHNKNKYKCDLCTKSFCRPGSLRKHLEKHKADTNKTSEKRSLKRHKKNTQESFSFSCTICKRLFPREAILKNHMEYDHRENNKCKICGKDIKGSRRLLRYHEKRHLHEESRVWKCHHCDRVLKTRTGLRCHIATHTGQYKMFCEVCGRGFMSQVILDEHMGVHTHEERYVCDVCGKKFCFNATYRVHRLWHDNPTPYECKECGRKFTHTSLLAVHKRRAHTGEKPYQCERCPLAFICSSTLKRHIRTHTGERPHKCPHCGRGFNERKILLKHMVTDHNDLSALDSKPKCEYKMVIKPDFEEPEITEAPVLSDDESQEISNLVEMQTSSMENAIIEVNDIANKETLQINLNDLPEGYQIIDGDINVSDSQLLDAVDETNIIIKIDQGDMIIKNGQILIPDTLIS